MAAARFISEPIEPLAGSADPSAMARGEPGLPRQFIWREQMYHIEQILEAWKHSQPEGHRPGNERYLKRHYWRVRTSAGDMMTLYCLRTARRGTQRWFLYTIDS
jgi:hypothetical protein